MNWITFYAVSMWTNRFWAWGAAYTIVKNRHIGLDIGTGRRAVDVPALFGGRVVIVTKTESMGWVVVIDSGLPGNRRYHAYCHLSGDRLPRAGSMIDRNGRVGRLAAGPRGVPYTSVEYPGTAWDGIHLHLVLSDIAHGAYTRNTGATFANPEDLIREALAGQAASNGSKPFDPEEDDMFTDDDRRKLTEAMDAVTPGKEGVKFDGYTYKQAKQAADRAQAALDAIARIEAVVVGDIDRAGGAMGGKTNLRSVIAWYDQNNIVLRAQITEATTAMTKSVVEALAKVPGVDPKVVQEAIAKAVSGSVLDPNVIGKAVAADLAKRLAS